MSSAASAASSPVELSLQASEIAPIHEFLHASSSWYFLHRFVSWGDVITTEPNSLHFYWVPFFMSIAGLTHLICHLFGHAFARRLIGYEKYPPLPAHISIMKSSNYLQLGQLVHYRRKIKLHALDLPALARATQLEPADIKHYVLACNAFHRNARRLRHKIQAYLFPIVYKVCAFALGLRLFVFNANASASSSSWVWDHTRYFAGWPYAQQLVFCADVKLFYLLHIGWYLYGIFCQLFRSTPFWAARNTLILFVHHLAATLLILLSYELLYLRIGVIVLLLHHPSDIILQSAKFWGILKVNVLCNLFFVLLCITWLLTRIIIFPYLCIYKTIEHWPPNRLLLPPSHARQSTNGNGNGDGNANVNVDGSTTMSVLLDDENDGIMDLHAYYEYWTYVLVGLMVVVYVLHLHWFNLLRVAVLNLVQGKDLQTKEHK